MNKGELLHWKEIIERWGGTTDCMPIQQTLLGIIDALLKEPKPVVSEAKRSSYVFDVDFSCISCQQVLSHLTRKNSKTKVRLCMGVDKKTWHFLEELEENV